MTVSMLMGDLEAESLISDWATEAAKDGASQLRKEPRIPLLTPVTINHNGMEHYAICRDISKKGIGVIQSGGSPKMGLSTISISLHQQVVYLDVDFTWRRELGSGWWASGGNMSFASIDFASMMLLRMSNAVERRVHRRQPFCQLFSLYPSLELEEGCVGVQNLPPETGVFAISMEISFGGMSLMCDRPVEDRNEYVYLQTRESQRSNSLIRGQIVSQRELGNGYFIIGVKFDFG